MGFIAGYQASILYGGVQLDCELRSSVTVRRAFEKIICKQNAPAGELALQDIEGEMQFEGALQEGATNNGFDLAQDLKDGTSVVCIVGGPSGERAIRFNAAYVTEVTPVDAAAEDSIARYSGTITLGGTFDVITF